MLIIFIRLTNPLNSTFNFFRYLFLMLVSLRYTSYTPNLESLKALIYRAKAFMKGVCRVYFGIFIKKIMAYSVEIGN